MEFAVSVPSVPEVARDWAVDSLTWAREMETPSAAQDTIGIQPWTGATGLTSG